MKRKRTALVVAGAMVLLMVTAGLAANVLFEDKFTTLNLSWDLPSAKIHVKDGKLVITPDKNETLSYLNQAAVLPNDMEASYTITFIKAPDPDSGSGFIFWAKDYNEYYVIETTPNGSFAIERYMAKRWLLPVPWQQSDAIKKGVGADNQVKVVTKDNQATVTINGKEVASFSGQPPEGGSLIGFMVATGAAGSNSAGFSNFQVVQP